MGSFMWDRVTGQGHLCRVGCIGSIIYLDLGWGGCVRSLILTGIVWLGRAIYLGRDG